MILSKEKLANINTGGIEKPPTGCLVLPEKVLQFGTGVLLRGLPDYFIDKANSQGIFNGRIVVVKSTGNGGTDAFSTQDNLFTHYIRGVEQGARKEEARINCSISRVLSASESWNDILACAADEAMQVVISNTTEVGLTLLPGDDLKAAPPKSFPGKLTAFLYARYIAFNGDAEKGMVIIPTELIPDNGNVLKRICVQLAEANGLEEAFITWLTTANDFCNSLVDCIVPGALPAEEAQSLAEQNGYKDDLHITSETYRLWAIETSRSRTREILSFSSIDEGVIVTSNIDKFRELKLRLLNGAHTFTCGLAVLSDFSTVKEAMSNEFFENFIGSLMKEEITDAILSKEISKEDAISFSNKVLDRFRNPFIEHLWLSITMQYTSKMGMRCVPVIREYYNRFNEVPKHMAAGFGAYILFMRSALNEHGQYIGTNCGKKYVIQDDKAALLHEKWKSGNPETVVHEVLADTTLWGSDLSLLPGFEKAVIAIVRKFLGQSADAIARQTATLAA
jgi:tagaturonate reductase